MSDTRRIITTLVSPPSPGPIWTAVFEGYDGAESKTRDPIGWGETEAEAIEDLKEQDLENKP